MKTGKAFPDEETFRRIYEKSVEAMPYATRAVRNNHRKMERAFDKYLAAIQENMFRYAYQCGYEAGTVAVRKGGAV